MKRIALFTITLGLLFTACDDKKDFLVKIKTQYGDMTVLLYEETPLHKKNFLQLARDGKYDSTIFHRVIKDFMIQGGNVAEKEGTQEKEADKIPAEIVSGFYHTKGALAAARQGDAANPEKKSSSTQFYIVDGQPWKLMSTDINKLYGKMVQMLQDSTNIALIEEYQPIYASKDQAKIMEYIFSKKEMIEDTFDISLNIDPKTENNELYEKMGGGSPHLDGEYTVFGKVVEGLDVIDKIAAVKTNRGDRPLKPVHLSMEILEMKKKEITEKYGYQYSK